MTHSSFPMTPLRQYHVRPSQEALSSLHTASTLVLSCVDFRLRDEIARFFNQTLQIQDHYDELCLPGASLAFLEPSKPHWVQTVEDSIRILQSLHRIHRIIFIDHMGCGAYRAIKGESMHDPAKETMAHLETLRQARQKVHQFFPGLTVQTFLMDWDGTITEYA